MYALEGTNLKLSTVALDNKFTPMEMGFLRKNHLLK